MTDLPDMNDLFRQAMAMQEQLMAAQQEAAEQTVTGSAGGGLVRVVMTGSGDPTEVHIAPDANDPDDPDLLEDLVLAALRDAIHQVRALQASTMGGLDLGGLAGLGGLGGPDQLGPGEG